MSVLDVLAPVVAVACFSFLAAYGAGLALIRLGRFPGERPPQP